jgi:hypothetical protein
MSFFDQMPSTISSSRSAHLGHAYRNGEREWVAVDNYGRPVATIWTPYLGRPGTFRCDPLPHARYARSRGRRLLDGPRLRTEQLLSRSLTSSSTRSRKHRQRTLHLTAQDGAGIAGTFAGYRYSSNFN